MFDDPDPGTRTIAEKRPLDPLLGVDPGRVVGGRSHALGQESGPEAGLIHHLKHLGHAGLGLTQEVPLAAVIFTGGEFMTRIEEIENAVASLPVEGYRQFREWFLERDWTQWDKRLEADSKSGKLDFLVKEALEEKSQGNLRKL